MNLNGLIPYVRLQIGDTNPDTYRYTNEWIQTSLVLATKTLQRYWNFRYLIDDYDNVTRNPNSTFLFPEEYGVIQKSDEFPIVLMACIILLEGSLENNAYSAVSWKDNEISFSNLEQFRTKDANLQRLVRMLNDLLLPPTKKLARTRSAPLIGYLRNEYERNTQDPK